MDVATRQQLARIAGPSLVGEPDDPACWAAATHLSERLVAISSRHRLGLIDEAAATQQCADLVNAADLEVAWLAIRLVLVALVATDTPLSA